MKKAFKIIALFLVISIIVSLDISIDTSGNGHFLHFGEKAYADAQWTTVATLYGGQSYTFDQANYVYEGRFTQTFGGYPAFKPGTQNCSFALMGPMAAWTGPTTEWAILYVDGLQQTETGYFPVDCALTIRRTPRFSAWTNVATLTTGQSYNFDLTHYIYAYNASGNYSWDVNYFGGTPLPCYGYLSSSLNGAHTIYLSSGSLSIYRMQINNPPSLSISAPTTNGTFTEVDTAFKPIITVSDVDNNTITCKYYVDSETSARGTETVADTNSAKSVTFSSGLNMNILTEGAHTIKCEVSDGVSAAVTQTVSIKVDRTAPNIGAITAVSSFNTITLSGSATDNVSGLDSFPYRFTINSTQTSWLTATSNTWSSLAPNTQNQIKFEARDSKGHIVSNTQNIYTKAAVPSITVNNPSSYTIDVSTIDNNPTSTLYQISTNSDTQFVTTEGTFTTGATWIALPSSKKITVSGLTPDTAYTFKMTAKNTDGVLTTSVSSSGTTLVPPPGSPANITATSTNNSITIKWDAVIGATGYDIETDGTVSDMGTNTSYTHTGLTQNTQHTYRVRAKSASGAGNWSNPITKSTLPNTPGVPVNLVATSSAIAITIVWDSVGGATGYDIEIDGVIQNLGPTTNYVHKGLTPGTNHSYRVRSINPAGKSDWSGFVNATTSVVAPLIPANLVATPSQTQMLVSWNAIAGVTYDLEVDGIVVDNSNRTTYTHTNLLPETQHTYRVRAKQSGTISDWSTLLTISTLANVFGIPANIKANASDTSVSLTWDSVTEAIGYDVEADGLVIDNGTNTSCIHNSLQANTSHTYRLRARNETQTSDWSNPITILTFSLPTPSIITSTTNETSIIVNWAEVLGAEKYDIEIDGVVTENLTSLTYTCSGLQSNTLHTFRIRAKNETGTSAWSTILNKSTSLGGDNIPAKISALSRNDSITVIWSEVLGSTAYDIEVDGTVTTLDVVTSFKHTGLTPGTNHTYRVRSKNASRIGDWSKLITVSTLPNGPAVPINLTASSSTTSVKLSWDEALNATEYDIEVDGSVISNGEGNSYLHSNLHPGTSHTYRIRSKNINGMSNWSEAKTISTRNSTEVYSIDCTNAETFNLLLTASDLDSPNGYTYTITYDSTKLEVLDLCAETAKADLAVGTTVGTDIKVIQFVPGTIVFIKTGIISPGDSWSGFVNSIKFKAKSSGVAEVNFGIN